MSLIVTDGILHLDVYQNKYIVTNVTQNDASSRKLHIVLHANGMPFKLDPTNQYARVQIRKPDGTNILNDCDILTDGSIEVVLSEQSCFAPGKADANLNIVGVDPNNLADERVLHTMHFGINVIPDVYPCTCITSSSEYQSLNAALIEIGHFSAYKDTIEYLTGETTVNAQNAKHNSDLSRSYAVGGTGTRTGENTDNAKYYAKEASDAALAAADSERNAKTSETNAKNSEIIALQSIARADEVAENALKVESWTEGTAKKPDGTDYRAGQATDNAAYYYDQCKNITASIIGPMKPMGTIKFNQLPTITYTAGTGFPDQVGWEYNMSEDFVSDNRFKDGGNIKYKLGTNVYCTADGKWDCLSAPQTTTDAYSATEPIGQSVNDTWYKPY